MRRLIATVLLPLSLIPVAIAVPFVAQQRENFRARYLEREPLAVPDIERVAALRVPAYRDEIPVLVYHGINDDGGRWNVTQEDFAAHMASLDAAGFHAVDAQTYTRFARGKRVKLPSRPILITFDDGRLDSYRGADAVLDEHGFKATMFAISSATVDRSRTYLSDDELREMQASGRWDIQFHAGQGHTHIEFPDGTERPWYAAREHDESFAEFRERVEEDLDEGVAELGDMVPDAELRDLFAVPYSDFGQAPGGDPRVALVALRAMTERFTGVFVQRSRLDPTERGDSGLLTRFEPPADMTPASLLRELRRGTTVDKEA